MKILFVNTLYAPNAVGGAERFVQCLAEGVVKAGHQAVVVSTAPQKGTRSDVINGVRAYYVGLKNLYWPYGDSENHRALKPLAHALDTYNPWMAREVARILNTEAPDLVHTNNLAGFSVLTWQQTRQWRLPLVHTLHDHYLLCPRSTMFRGGKNCATQCAECRLYALPRKRPSTRVDVVVGVSRYILERHLEFGYFISTPVKKVIPNAYQRQSGELRSDAPSLPIRFGYLGMLHPNKGVVTLLESAKRLSPGTWSLCIGGRGYATYERHLRANYDLPAVRFLGYVSPEIFFPQIDVLVVPSPLSETFGRVVIEAYAHGVPVIASNRGAMPELVEEGRTGYSFDPSSLGHLAAKMRAFLHDPATIRRMEPNCLEKARGFLPTNVTEQYIETYYDIVGNT